MKETLISVTIAARKFADCINRVRYQGISFLLEKNGVPVARIVPVQQNFGESFESLAMTLRQARSSASEIGTNRDQPPSTEKAVIDSNPDLQSTRDLKRPRLNW